MHDALRLIAHAQPEHQRRHALREERKILPTEFRTNDDAQQPKLRLQVDTIETSWVSAYADGRKSWEARMGARETRTVEAQSEIQLKVGNAAAVVLTLNGETQPPLGRKGEAKMVAFSAGDFKHQ